MNMKFFILILIFVGVESYFDFIQDRVEVLYQNETFTNWKDLRFRKINKTTRALVGKIVFYVDFGNQIMIEMKSYKKQGKIF